jgi:MFS family permease
LGIGVGKLAVLMVTAFADMVGLLMVLPLLPFYATRMTGTGVTGRTLELIGFGGEGAVVAILVSSFAVAQLISAPFWGRVSDKYGRRPALLIGLGASAIAYVVFAFAGSLDILLLSRLVQGAGGGTVGVIQAYVADATRPEERAKALGWLSAATNAGVAIGPVLGSLSAQLGPAAPGLCAAAFTLVNMVFAYRYLDESHDVHAAKAAGAVPRRGWSAISRVVSHSSEPASRLIWIYAIGMGAFHGMTAILALFLAWRFGVTEKTIGYFFMYIGIISVFTRAVVLGRLVDALGEARLSRLGMALLAIGLVAMPLAPGYPTLALAVALIPLGTAFTFPCVTGMLSRVVSKHERGLYMGVQQTFGGVARVAGPIWAGWAFDVLGKGVPFYTGAGMVVGAMLLGIGIEHAVGLERPPA